MLRTILKYGAIGGVIVAIPTFTIPIQFRHNIPDGWAMAIGYTSMLAALTTVFLGIKHLRDTAGGGVIGFWRALGVGLAISFVAGIFYVLAWELVLVFTHMDFAGDYARSVIAHARARGMAADKLAKLTASMADFQKNYANPAYRMTMTFSEIAPVGVLVSLVSAALLRSSRFLPARISNG